MKSLSNTVIEKLEINKDYKLSWVIRRNEQHASSEDNIKMKKFIKFFHELRESSDLGISILYKYINSDDNIITDLYYIRETEPNKILHNGGSPRTYDYITHILFDEEQNDIHRKRDIFGKLTYKLVLLNIEDDIDMLKNIGFEDYDRHNLDTSRCDLWEDLENIKGMYITFNDLYDNIDKIYKAFFE